MKKGMHYRIWRFKLKTMRYYISNVLAYILVSIGSVISMGLNITLLCLYHGGGKEMLKDIFSLIISATAFVVALIGIINKSRADHRSYFNRPILEQEGHKKDVRKSVLSNISKTHSDSGFEWREYDGQYYLVSERVNDALFYDCKNKCNNLRIIVNPKKQEMTAKQKEILYNIVTKKIAEGKSIFNSELVRLRTDILTGLFSPFDKQKYDDKDKKRKNIYKSFSEKLIALEKTDYEANITTNDQIYSEIFQYDYSSSYCGKDKTVDSVNTLYDLKDSPAANIIGVTTFAITSDYRLLLNLQGEMNDVNNGCFVPSGSGSSDFEDLIKSAEFEPEKLRKEVEYYRCGLVNPDEFDEPRRFKEFKNKYLDELSKSEDGSNDLVELYYKNAETAKLERKGFKGYASKMKKYTYDFNTFLKYGMVRELIEESHLYEKEFDDKSNSDCKRETVQKLINNTYVCGYIRILDRGGKPDFFGITLLDLTSSEVENMFKRGRNKAVATEIKKNCTLTDFNEVSEQKYPSILNIEEGDVKKFIMRSCNLEDKDPDKIKISLQTHCLFELICKNKDEIIKLIDKNNQNKTEKAVQNT